MTQDMTIIEQAETLAAKVLATPATDQDIDTVNKQLGRYPRGMIAVGARCACGRPLAVVTRPLLPGGVPFPTTCYLTGPEAVKAISHIEAEGRMKEYNDLLAEDAEVKAQYERAHELYLAFRHEIAKPVSRAPVRVVCRCASNVCTHCWPRRWLWGRVPIRSVISPFKPFVTNSTRTCVAVRSISKRERKP